MGSPTFTTAHQQGRKLARSHSGTKWLPRAERATSPTPGRRRGRQAHEHDGRRNLGRLDWPTHREAARGLPGEGG